MTDTQDIAPADPRTVVGGGADIPITDTPPVLTSPSFWITMVPVISAVLGFFLHKQIDLSGSSAAIGLIGASIATAALAISRSMRHKAVLEANTAAQSMHLGQREIALQQHAFATHDSVAAAFSDVEQDMRAHNERLKALEDVVQPTKHKPTTTAKKTTARKAATAQR